MAQMTWAVSVLQREWTKGKEDENQTGSKKTSRSTDCTLKDVHEGGTGSNRKSERFGEREPKHWTYRPSETERRSILK